MCLQSAENGSVDRSALTAVVLLGSAIAVSKRTCLLFLCKRYQRTSSTWPDAYVAMLLTFDISRRHCLKLGCVRIDLCFFVYSFPAAWCLLAEIAFEIQLTSSIVLQQRLLLLQSSPVTLYWDLLYLKWSRCAFSRSYGLFWETWSGNASFVASVNDSRLCVLLLLRV